eukprot:5930321-Amphidinium_carterae.2
MGGSLTAPMRKEPFALAALPLLFKATFVAIACALQRHGACSVDFCKYRAMQGYCRKQLPMHLRYRAGVSDTAGPGRI